MTAHRVLLSPFRLGALALKNRLVSAAHANGFAVNGKPQERYQTYHEARARGGIGLIVIGGSSNISRDSGSIYGQIYVGNDDVIPYFQETARRVHRYDCGIMCQLTHMGRRTSWLGGDWMSTVGPSPIRDPAHNALPRAAELADIQRITKDFGDAAVRCQEGGLDGCEILASVHILGQFLSPLSNARNDDYGGSLVNRARFLIEVLEEVRARVGEEFVVGLRFTADESNEGGLTAEEGVELAGLIGRSKLVDCIHVNGAYGGTAKGMSEAFPGMGSPSAPFLDIAKRVKETSGLPTMQAARITDPATASFAIESGYLDLVGMVRPHIADPQFAAKLSAGNEARIRPCVGAALCMDRVDLGGDMVCLHNVSVGREIRFPEIVERTDVPGRIVVVGGGPAGMEAARVARLRGHDVVLLEASNQLGGQIVLASMAGWRRDLIGVADWLAHELEVLGVDVRFDCLADRQDIIAMEPDTVIVATGGIPNARLSDGGEEFINSTWEVLSGEQPTRETILIYDEVGEHAAISVADWLASSGHDVELVSPARACGAGLGSINYPKYLENLSNAGARLTPNHILLSVRADGNALVARLRHAHSRKVSERRISQVISDQGTIPNDEIFVKLKALSNNRGKMDLNAFAEGEPQPHTFDTGSGFALYRAGDVVSGRNIHAAMLDGNRIARTL